ncbi:probable 3',5'-cyclic phosphodiesterase pde-5 isoform X1 [Topomyia yanbarensis]|uniref:probable 3',5'-cyclic phosphodiesterase pde-5 isoform X1 n=2 Tax=Topomyia yanbarensis TaxID=2498891 RepID=UPI00273B155B|nr:probable 3',5'-cyclic phosphodiesterase pde-5 isoform X1 [Topomyia yanbarensis]XP_058820515.1 probable 3',5'-cyclic phosphodiesterase pde-5 isoform X1 [Topomyia yanbarensis]XP_058820516.1 probable 3',5'-cyclic phosphodiesterase pde-5 isoform X1 [Topomyia yanbarensis]XP_058820517.1 probable 3',5'-cyclic phosphodiesterase pde-5 isoform X1 [Topomyia yanbarensis]XP_058820519.1 probable 3',5'-cyclic phosphodiesterase pde-5 isoform X1 [Topomyia yanbarensis]XP_058820520.1 probable 3',5'-cyclic pho
MEILTRVAGSFAGLWRNRRRPHHEDEIPRNQTIATNTNLSAIQVTKYLQSNPDFLDTFVMDEIQLEQLERWMIRKTQRTRKIPQPIGKNGRKTSLSRWKFCVHADKRQMLQDLIHSLQLRPTKMHVLWELASCICSAVNADGFRLYLTDVVEAESLHLCLSNNFIDENGDPKPLRIKSDAVIPNYVAKTRELIRFSKGDSDHRFDLNVLDKSEMAHVMCQPIVYPDGSLVAVLELWRRDCGTPFYEEDEEIGCSYLVWGGIAIHYAHLNLVGLKQRKLNDFLLAVVKSIFQDMVSMDMLVSKIMNFAQRLVDADRASLFLVDSKSKELYATIFDVGCEDKISKGDNENENKVPKEIRFPIGTGIAGQVAMTGEILNIIDAYADSRFNRSIDQLTGYRTESILCMPIFIRGNVIGVVQMINKRAGYFNKEDEEAFEMFAVYCGLALHHAKLYDKIRRSEQKYRVSLEVLSYHNTCSEKEVEKCLEVGIPQRIPNIDQYDFSPFENNDFQKAMYSVYMFKDLFGLGRFDKTNLIRFTLTVKKNYRRVPYHNWTHGFSVANTMYSMIKNCSAIFRPNESLALFIGSLCHDLDHRGKNNKFMLDTESPLAAIYSTSTMEHHHFNQTVTILQQEGHNIFSKLSSSEYKQVLSLIKHCILATDLALFFPNKEKLNALVDEERFSWTISEHRMLIQAIAMTGADLSASAKPWEVQTETVKVIFAEFYDQGDEEKKSGRKPIPMMDRDQPEEQAASQLGFLTGICIPCYTLLHRLIPETKPMLDMCNENLTKWQDIAKGIRKFDQ